MFGEAGPGVAVDWRKGRVLVIFFFHREHRMAGKVDGAGSESRCRINLPAGPYIPEFCFVPAAATQPDERVIARPRRDGPLDAVV